MVTLFFGHTFAIANLYADPSSAWAHAMYITLVPWCPTFAIPILSWARFLAGRAGGLPIKFASVKGPLLSFVPKKALRTLEKGSARDE